jgi:sortase A
VRTSWGPIAVHGAVFVACLGVWQLAQGAYIPAKAWLAQALMQHAWNSAREGEHQPTPWPWADTWPVARLSSGGDGDDIDLIVLAGSSGRTLAFGPGHLSESALPGTSGNAVIAGHRDTHFRFLQSLGVGESLLIETPSGHEHRYTVTAVEIVDSRSARLLLDTDDSLLSLVTCYPFDAIERGGPMRYVVTAKITHGEWPIPASHPQP